MDGKAERREDGRGLSGPISASELNEQSMRQVRREDPVSLRDQQNGTQVYLDGRVGHDEPGDTGPHQALHILPARGQPHDDHGQLRRGPVQRACERQPASALPGQAQEDEVRLSLPYGPGERLELGRDGHDLKSAVGQDLAHDDFTGRRIVVYQDDRDGFLHANHCR